VCKDVGLLPDPMLLGADVEKMSDAERPRRRRRRRCSHRSPADKERVIRVLRARGTWSGSWATASTDAPPCVRRTSGISVDTATDIAKESADLILLEKDLMVLEGGVIEGARFSRTSLSTFGWERAPTSGTCSACWERAAFLPFLPMAPIQVLTNNLLYDFLAGADSSRRTVDEEQVAKPRPWTSERSGGSLISYRFRSDRFSTTRLFFRHALDLPLLGSHPDVLFQTGWFVESFDDADAYHPRHSHKQDSLPSEPASWALTATTFSIMAFGAWLPYPLWPRALGFTHLPRGCYWPILMLTLLSYMGLTQIIKVWAAAKSTGSKPAFPATRAISLAPRVLSRAA